MRMRRMLSWRLILCMESILGRDLTVVPDSHVHNLQEAADQEDAACQEAAECKNGATAAGNTEKEDKACCKNRRDNGDNSGNYFWQR